MESLIIHFTSRFNTLLKILDSTSLKLSYCREDFVLGNQRISSAAHPMACFSEFKNENIYSTYGQYGVGFSVDWAIQKKMNPVSYIEKNSIMAKGLSTLLRARQNKLNSELPLILRLPIMQLKCFTKNVKGYNSFFGIDDFDFKNENEWRFIPSKQFIEGKFISLHQSTYNRRKEFYNHQLEKYPLRFNLEDVKCIYVNSEEEQDYVIDKYNVSSTIVKIASWDIIVPNN